MRRLAVMLHVLALMLFVAACAPAESGAPAPLSPEEVLAERPTGPITVRGTVFTITFDETHSPYHPLADRWVLIRSGSAPSDVVFGDPTFDQSKSAAAWGLGLHLTAAQMESHAFLLPQIGDVVEATGVFAEGAWNASTRAMLNDLTRLEVVEGAAPLSGPGKPCRLDSDCRDDLICDRAKKTCTALAQPMAWDDAWHDVNGACDTDQDCPLGEVCDPTYSMQQDGDFAPNYRHDADVGRHLCVVPASATRQDVCPHPASTQDLVGGRWVTGREVCVEGTVLLEAHAPDGDTHDQLVVTEPLPYPAADAPYYLWGAVSENSPPYKDPTRPGGALADPALKEKVIVLGTYRFDGAPDATNGHGWFEIHPIKKWWAAGN